MSKKCAKCGRPIVAKKCNCDKWVTLAAQPKTVEVRLELTLDELTVVAETLEQEAANFRYTGGGDWEVQAEILETVARAFRKAPAVEHCREAEDAHVQWRHAQE